MRQVFVLGSALALLTGCNWMNVGESDGEGGTIPEPYDSSQGRPFEDNKVRSLRSENEQAAVPATGQPSAGLASLAQIRQFMIGTLVPDPGDTSQCSSLYTITFLEDGTYRQAQGFSGRWSLREQGNAIMLTMEATSEGLPPNTDRVELAGDTLRLSGGAQTGLTMLRRCPS